MNMPALADDWERGLSGQQLGQAITLLSAQINAANHRLLRLIAEFDRSRVWAEQGSVRSCAHWLAANCGLALGAAREKVRVARQLQVLPELDEAFAQGGLSYSKLRAVTRVATPNNEGFMLHLAQRNSAGHLEKLVSRYEPVAAPGLDELLEDDPGQGTWPGGAPGVDAAAAKEAPAADGDECAANGDAPQPPQDIEAMRELAREAYWFQDKDGMWIIHAKLPPEQGQLVMKALQAVVRPLEEERQEAWKEKQRARLQAVARRLLQRGNAKASRACEDESAASPDAVNARPEANSVEAGRSAHAGPGCSGGALGDGLAAAPVAGDSCGSASQAVPNHLAYAWAEEKISAETYSQHMNQVRADALVAMVEHFLAGGSGARDLQGLKGAERCQVVMHVDLNTLREQRSGLCCTHGRAHFEDKPWLSPATARRLSCDASLVTVLEDEAGKVLNVGRRSRIVPAPIRRALRERDGVCQFPGCQESEYVDAHHIQHWAEGGETRLDNLVTLCRFHHRQLHRGCFDIRWNGVSAEILWGKGGE